MAFFEWTTQVTHPRLLEAFAEVYRDAPETVRKLTDEVVFRIEPQLLADLGKYPGPVKYPIQWKSERQRRAFFATKGFGKGIPYHRTYTWGKAWHLSVEVTENWIVGIYAKNNNPVRQFVTGDYQQPFHTNTGWQKDADTFTIWGMILEDQMETALIQSFYKIEEGAR